MNCQEALALPDMACKNVFVMETALEKVNTGYIGCCYWLYSVDNHQLIRSTASFNSQVLSNAVMSANNVMRLCQELTAAAID